VRLFVPDLRFRSGEGILCDRWSSPAASRHRADAALAAEAVSEDTLTSPELGSSRLKRRRAPPSIVSCTGACGESLSSVLTRREAPRAQARACLAQREEYFATGMRRCGARLQISEGKAVGVRCEGGLARSKRPAGCPRAQASGLPGSQRVSAQPPEH